MKQSVIPFFPAREAVQELPHNCWRVVVDQIQACQQQEVHQQSSALMLLDLWIRRSLEKGPLPATVSLFWYDANGQEHLLVETYIPALLPL